MPFNAISFLDGVSAEVYAERSYIDHLIMNTILYRIIYFLSLTMHDSGSDADADPTKYAALSHVLNYIQCNLEQPLSVDTIARATNTTVYSLYKQFKNAMGITPWQYIINIRLERARDFMRKHPDMSIKEIGIAVGMPSKNYLNQHFKDRYGITPSQFRKSLPAGSNEEIHSFSEKILPVYLVHAPVIDMIHMHYRQKLTLSSLAEVIGVNTSTLLRLFQVVYKMTPKEYITDVRLKQAKRLLLHYANKSVHDIAKSTGFSSSSHLIAAFKKREHVTPQEYRDLYF